MTDIYTRVRPASIRSPRGFIPDAIRPETAESKFVHRRRSGMGGITIIVLLAVIGVLCGWVALGLSLFLAFAALIAGSHTASHSTLEALDAYFDNLQKTYESYDLKEMLEAKLAEVPPRSTH